MVAKGYKLHCRIVFEAVLAQNILKFNSIYHTNLVFDLLKFNKWNRERDVMSGDE